MMNGSNEKVKEVRLIALSYSVNELARHRSVRSYIDFQQEIAQKRAQ